MSTPSERNPTASIGIPLSVQVECTFVAVRRVAGEIRTFLASQGFSETDIWACELALVEGCNNAIQHTPASATNQKLLIELTCASTHIELRINDHTRGFDFPAEVTLPGDTEENGRGIYLMRALMDQVDYIRRDSSNCLILKKSITGI